MVKILLIAFLLSTVIPSLNKNQLAEITFHDKLGKIHTLHLQYFIENQRLQYGVKFGTNLYEIEVEDCKAVLSDLTEEYFAVYLRIPENCSALDVIHQCETHGANFVFIDATKSINSQSKLLTNSYQIPVFHIEASDDLFLLESSGTGKQYISLFFLMVV